MESLKLLRLYALYAIFAFLACRLEGGATISGILQFYSISTIESVYPFNGGGGLLAVFYSISTIEGVYPFNRDWYPLDDISISIQQRPVASKGRSSRI